MKQDLPAAASGSFSFRTFTLRPDPLKLSAYHTAMIGAVVGVLLIACANVCAPTLACGLGRQRDCQHCVYAAWSDTHDLGAVRTAEVFDTAHGSGMRLPVWSRAGWGLSVARGVDSAVGNRVVRVSGAVCGVGESSPQLSAPRFTAALASILPGYPSVTSRPGRAAEGQCRNDDRAGELAIPRACRRGARAFNGVADRGQLDDQSHDSGRAIRLRIRRIRCADLFVSEPKSGRFWARAKRRSTDDLAPIIDCIRTVPGVERVTFTSTASPDSSIVISEATHNGAPPLALKTYQKIGLDYVRNARTCR